MIKSIFYKVFQNISECYKNKKLIAQLTIIPITYILVVTNFDWEYFSKTQTSIIKTISFPSVIIGFFLPILLPILINIVGRIKNNERTINTSYAITQAELLGFSISTFYKVFTGRVGLPHSLITDTSHIFRFGFLRGGAFQGWPSSHTSTAFAMSFALIALYPEKKWVKFIALTYAIYIGLGVSTTIHWFSDFTAGVILGSLIGISVGKSFLNKKFKQCS